MNYGIVAEFNPFHNGHKYQINSLKNNDFSHIVVAMSGNFVQRAEPAIFPKEYRVKAEQLKNAIIEHCWDEKDEGVFTERYVTQIDGHDCRMFRCKLVKVR